MIGSLVLLLQLASDPPPSGAPTIDQVPFDGGSFDMGHPHFTDAQPIQPVTVAPFSLSRTEVTVAQYAQCVAAGACEVPRSRASDRRCNWGHKRRDDHPINCVGREQAETFAEWVGARLPTEAEHEWAARSAERRWDYPWGSATPTCDIVAMSNCRRREGTRPVCSLPAGHSDQGLCDLLGNVSEWTSHPWHPDLKGHPGHSGAWPGTHHDAALRGGGWRTPGRDLHAAYRSRASPSDHDVSKGIRLAWSLPMPEGAPAP